MKLRRRSLARLAHRDPAGMEDYGSSIRRFDIQRDLHLPQQPAGVHPAGRSAAARIDRNLKLRPPGENRLRAKAIDVRTAEVEGGSESGISAGR